MMMRACFRPLERCFARRGGGDGLLWHSDLKPHASGDYSIAAVQANSNMEDQSQVFTSPSATYVGIYDGHGGPEASRFVNKHLFPFMHKFANEQGGLSVEVIKKAFNATEEEFCHLVNRSLQVKPQIASVGSCCLVGAISNDVLYVANLGDSRAVLGRKVNGYKSNPVISERLSTDHNVKAEEVRKEVQALHPDDSQIVVYARGCWRIKGIIQGIAKRLVRAALNKAAMKKELRYDDIKDVQKGVRRHIHDDITVIVIFLDQPRRSSSHGRLKKDAIGCMHAPIDIYSRNAPR
ncbi:Probable protein phosphatase 2C 63 [Linum grandiflorum]